MSGDKQQPPWLAIVLALIAVAGLAIPAWISTRSEKKGEKTPDVKPSEQNRILIDVIDAKTKLSVREVLVRSGRMQASTDKSGQTALNLSRKEPEVPLEVEKEGYLKKADRLPWPESTNPTPFVVELERDPSLPRQTYGKQIVSIKVEKDPLPLKSVLKPVAERLGLTLAWGPFVQEPQVTMTTTGELADILDELCKTYRCEWDVAKEPSPMLLVTPIPQ